MNDECKLNDILNQTLKQTKSQVNSYDANGKSPMLEFAFNFINQFLSLSLQDATKNKIAEEPQPHSQADTSVSPFLGTLGKFTKKFESCAVESSSEDKQHNLKKQINEELSKNIMLSTNFTNLQTSMKNESENGSMMFSHRNFQQANHLTYKEMISQALKSMD